MNSFIKDILNEVANYYTKDLLTEGKQMPVKKLLDTFKKFCATPEDENDLANVIQIDPTYPQPKRDENGNIIVQKAKKKDGTEFELPQLTGEYALYLANLWKNKELTTKDPAGLKEVQDALATYYNNREALFQEHPGDEYRIEKDKNPNKQTLFDIVNNVIGNGLEVKEEEKVDPYEKWLNEPEEEEVENDEINLHEVVDTHDLFNQVAAGTNNPDTLYAVGKGQEFEKLHKNPDGTVPERKVGESIDGELLIYVDKDWVAIAEENHEAGMTLGGGVKDKTRPNPGWCVDQYDDYSWNNYYNCADGPVNGQMIHLFSLHPAEGNRGHWLLSRDSYGGTNRQRVQWGKTNGYHNIDDGAKPQDVMDATGAKQILGVLSAMCKQWSLPFGKFPGEKQVSGADYTLDRFFGDANGWFGDLKKFEDTEKGLVKRIPIRKLLHMLADPKYQPEQLFDKVIPLGDTNNFCVEYNGKFNILTPDRQIVLRKPINDWWAYFAPYHYKDYYKVGKVFGMELKYNLFSVGAFKYIYGNDNDLGNWFTEISNPQQGNLAIVGTKMVLMDEKGGRDENGRLHALQDAQGHNVLAERKTIMNLDNGQLIINSDRYGWFNIIDNPHNGYAVIGKTLNEKQDPNFIPRWNFIDIKTGQMIFSNNDQNTWPTQVSQVNQDGFAVVASGRQYRLLNLKEKHIIPQQPADGLRAIGHDPKIEYDDEGNIISEKIEYIPEFINGLISVGYNIQDYRKYNLMDTEGDMVIPFNNMNLLSDLPMYPMRGGFVISRYYEGDDETNDNIEDGNYITRKNILMPDGQFLFKTDMSEWPISIRPHAGNTMVITDIQGNDHIINANGNNNQMNENRLIHESIMRTLRNMLR